MYLDLLSYKNKIEEEIKINESLILLCDVLRPLNGFTIKQEKKFLELFNTNQEIKEKATYSRIKKDGAYGESSITFILNDNPNAKIKYKVSTSSFILDFDLEKENFKQLIDKWKSDLSFFDEKNEEIEYFLKTLVNIKNELNILHNLEQSIVKEYNTKTRKESFMLRILKDEITNSVNEF